VRVVLTRHREEVTSVRRSITQVRIEAGSIGSLVTDCEVIELKPETPFREASSTLIVHPDDITDVVDLHCSSKTENFQQVTYSIPGTSRGGPFPESHLEQKALKSENESVPNSGQELRKRATDKPRVIQEERHACYDVRINRFIAVQKMTDFQDRIEKKLSLKIEV
jgi:hypothetical protein